MTISRVRKKLRRRRPRAEPIKICNILNFWNEHFSPFDKPKMWTEQNLDFHNKRTETITGLLQGTFFLDKEVSQDLKFKMFTEEEILNTIDDYHRVFDHFLKGKKMTLLEFLYNTWNKKVKSHFLFYYINGSYLASLVDIYVIGETSGLMPQDGLTQEDYRKFSMGAEKIKQFFDYNYMKIHSLHVTTPYHQVKMVYEAIRNQFPDQPVYPGHFASKFTYNTSLPQYLRNQGLLIG